MLWPRNIFADGLCSSGFDCYSHEKCAFYCELAAAITRNERYHQFYAVFFLPPAIVISFALIHTLV